MLWKSLTIGACLFVAYFVTFTGILWSLKTRLDPLVLARRLFIFMFVLASPIVWMISASKEPMDQTQVYLLSGIFLLFSHFGLLCFYSAVDHSVRIRLLCEMRRKGSRGHAKVMDLIESYEPEQATLRRLELMTHGGYLERDDATSAYRLTRKGEFLAKAVVCIKRGLGLGLGG